MKIDGDGSRSLGFEHERVAAGDRRPGTSSIGTMHGKLNGVMPATTPSGWRIGQLSMPVETWSV